MLQYSEINNHNLVKIYNEYYSGEEICKNKIILQNISHFCDMQLTIIVNTFDMPWVFIPGLK